MALRLKPDATFWAKVSITLPGGKVEVIEVEFFNMSRDEFDSYQGNKGDVSDAASVMRVAKNWKGVDGDFNEENIDTLLKNYHSAGRAIATAFVQELLQVRLGN